VPAAGAWTGIFNAKNGKNGEKMRSSRRKDGKSVVEAIQNTGVMGVHGIEKCSGERHCSSGRSTQDIQQDGSR